MRIRALPVVAAVIVTIVACGPKDQQPPMVPGSQVIKPARSVHLRAAFDNDPATYVGRMVADSVPPESVDENAASVTRCSQFVKAKIVDANQDLDEVVYASTQAGASIGIHPVAGASASSASSGVMRVKYTLKKKMQSEVTDADKFAQCCAAAPGQCSKTMIGTFLMGSGEVFQNYGSKTQVEASGLAKDVSGAIDYKDDIAWKRVNRFENTYFAFLTTGVGSGEAALPSDCSWCENVPTSLDGRYFCGISPNVVEEGGARDMAMRHAREQVLRFLGEYLTTQSASASNMVKGYLEDKNVVSAATAGFASQVKDQRWCSAERADTPNGRTYKSKVLAFFPESSRKDAAKVTLEAIIQTRKAEKKLTPEEETQLRVMISEQK